MLKVVDNNSRLLKRVVSYVIWTGRNRPLIMVCFLAGDGLVYGCYQIFPETIKSIYYVTNCKVEGL